jgi:hypothetical protein
MANTEIGYVKRKITALKHESLKPIPYHVKHYTLAYAIRYAGYKTSHSPLVWNTKETLCGCQSRKGYIKYMPFGHIHFIPFYRECEAGNMCWCLNVKTLELTRHPIGVCPDGRYEWVERG